MKNYTKIATDYANRVIKGKDPAGELEILMCKRFIDDLGYQAKAKAEFYYSKHHTNDVCFFIEGMPHIEGNWDTPTIVLAPFQVFMLANIYGWRWMEGKKRNPETDPRRITDVYIEIARGNAKSTLLSAICLYGLTCEGEARPQIRCAATTGDQARIIFDIAKAMAERTPDYREEYGVEPFANRIICNDNGGGFIGAVSSKASTQDGLNPFYSIVDEFHAHADGKLMNVLFSARGKRKNPLTIRITTAGTNITGPCYQERDMASKILTGALKPNIFTQRYFAAIFTVDKDDNNYLQKNWRKANPLWKHSKPLRDEITSQAKKAQAQPGIEPEFLTKRLNRWLKGSFSWIQAADWKACEDKKLSIDDFEGEDCWLGLDLANKDDLAALAILFQRKDVFYVFVNTYLPQDLVDRKVAEGLPFYKIWLNAGHLIATPGDFIDHRKIKEDIEAIGERFSVKGIYFDQFSGADIMASDLIDKGFEAEKLPSSKKTITVPAKDFEARVKTHRMIRHTGDPVLSWNVSNAHVTQGVDGSILPKKESKDSKDKIDGLDAVILAIAGQMEIQEKINPGVVVL